MHAASRHKTVKVALVAAVAVIGGYGAYTNQQKDVMSDLVLVNVEALAKIEELPEVEITCGSSSGTCWVDDGYEYTWTPFGGFKITRCKFAGYIWVSCVPGLPT